MNRSVLAYLTSYGMSFLGNSVAAVVLPLVVLQTTGSAMDAGIVAAATALPAFVAGLFMGSVVDRYDRRVVSVVTDVVSGAAVAALPITAMLTDLDVGWFVLFGVIGSFGDVPGLTAREALLLPVARRSAWRVDRLVGLRESLAALAMIIGPAIAAGLVTVLDGAQALWITAGLSLAAALITLIVSLPSVLLILGGAALVGTFGGMVSTVLGVLMTERIPEQLRGRVTGTQNALLTVAPSLGILGVGVMVDQVSIEAAGFAVGALWAVTVVVALVVPPLRDLSSTAEHE